MDEDEEVIVKAMTDYWVVGKKSDQRELYVILNQKNANLIEVNGGTDTKTPDSRHAIHHSSLSSRNVDNLFSYRNHTNPPLVA